MIVEVVAAVLVRNRRIFLQQRPQPMKESYNADYESCVRCLASRNKESA